MLELVDLISAIEEKFGVSATPPEVVTTGIHPVEESKVEEQTEFDVVLTEFGSKKIQVIKVVRAITGLPLKEAKTLVDGVPAIVKSAVNETDAQSIKSELETVGATIEIK